MGRLSSDQLIQCIDHLFATVPTVERQALNGLSMSAFTARLKSAAGTYKQARADLMRERKESAELEARGSPLKGRVYDLLVILVRVLDLQEVAGQIDPALVEAARTAILEGQNPTTATAAYSRAGAVLDRLMLAFAQYPWLDFSGDLRSNAAALHTEYKAFLTDRERELDESAAAQTAAQSAEETLYTLYYALKEMVRGYLRFTGAEPGLLETLFLDESPRWAARLAARSSGTTTDHADDTSSPAAPAATPSTATPS